MRLDLRKAMDGTHFVICIVSDVARKELAIPLSAELSVKIESMVRAEGIGMEKVLLPPNFARQ